MKNIEVKIMNPTAITEAEKMMIFAARLTQRGHELQSMGDIIDLYNRDYSQYTADSMVNLPHPTIQKFGLINIMVSGASRRFLAQITRHQNEVKFMSASLQYSDYSGADIDNFCVPYEITEKGESFVKAYLESCRTSMFVYKMFARSCGNDSAGYVAPQGLRNALLISVSPFELKHMIKQRICKRNTTETRYVMLRILEELQKYETSIFKDVLPECCKEGKMSCGVPYTKGTTAEEILDTEFSLIRGE